MSNETWGVERLATAYRERLCGTLPTDPVAVAAMGSEMIDQFLRAAERDRLICYKEGKCEALLDANVANEEIRTGLIREIRYLRVGGAV